MVQEGARCPEVMSSTPVAFVPGAPVARARRAEGSLSGLTFAVKDLFDLRGHAPSAGHPDWARSHPSAIADAPVVDALLSAGADLVGVTIMDELAYSLAGQNPHYGTPTNSRAPGRLCGGSSCGSAAAVASCLCDFALGTDTGGSIRVPASFCGLFGLRPSHGHISTAGVVPLAPSFDTVGFFARDARTFEAVGRVLLGSFDALPSVSRVLIADDALSLCDAGVAELLEDQLGKVLAALGASVQRIQLAPEGFVPYRTAFRRIQAREAWRAHGDWIMRVGPRFSPAVAQRFEMARAIAQTEEGLEQDARVRRELTERLEALLTPGTLLFLPAAPGVAPRTDESDAALETFRARTLELTSVASLAGIPQLVVPAQELKGAPIGLSFAAGRGQDAFLCSLAEPLERALAR